MDNILIVEDEEYIREFISINLKRNKFVVLESKSGEDAISILSNTKVDLVILDLKLPGMDGYSVCKIVKSKYPNTAVVMVTAKSQDMDKIMGLELGADDYITKPFNPEELLARIRAVLRRTKNNLNSQIESIQCDEIKIEYHSRKVYKGSLEVKLTPKEFDLIYILAKNPGNAYSRNQLFDLIWGESYFGDLKTLDVHVRRLREKIEDDSSCPRYIETVWGVGYRWKL